jgi:Citrate synthase
MDSLKRLNLVHEHLTGNQSLTITNNISGKTIEIPIRDNHIQAKDLAKLTDSAEPIMSYDPGYMLTICCTSKVSYIDGDKGILEYRGYPSKN